MDEVTLRAHAAACEAYALPEPLSDDPNRVERVYVQREAYEAGYLKALDGMERIEDAGGWMRGVWERLIEHYGVRDRMIVCMGSVRSLSTRSASSCGAGTCARIWSRRWPT